MSQAKNPHWLESRLFWQSGKAKARLEGRHLKFLGKAIAMGRYEALRPSLAKRLVLSFDEYLAARGITRPTLPRPTRARTFPVIGFLLTVGFVMVYIIDPYSGTLASAQTVQVFDPDSKQGKDALGEASEVSVSFDRGGFEVISGSKASALFVFPADSPEPGSDKHYAMTLLEKKNQGFDEFSCLVKLWTRESNWRHLAKNSSSGAYGIPQALPGSKMATEGADWMTNPQTQIRWGLKYIASRYKTPCGAWAHFSENNWY